ncbi:MAG: NAD(P)-dependent oxidoreductase [Candidatus Sericytochromatia bacterium]
MNKFKIGIIREEKNPPDKRVAITPEKCKYILENYENIDIFVQPSNIRNFSDEEYKKNNITLKEDLSDCDLLLGVKEVPIDKLIPNKKYMFFSHTIKLQAHNKKLLKEIINKKITMIDYEVITDKSNRRLIAFGKYAGIVGSYNAFLTTGKKLKSFAIKPAHQCFDMKELKKELVKVQLPENFKIVTTGDGRVASGCLEILETLKIKKVSPKEFLENTFTEPVYTQLKSKDMYGHKNNMEWNTEHFYNNPTEYTSLFKKYTKIADLYIACHFWNPKSDRLFNLTDIKENDFNIKVIADISCDINGAVPTTIRPSTISDPIYGFDKNNLIETNFEDPNAIAIMAIDNLPCELPRDSSEDFSNQFIKNVLPNFFNNDPDKIIERATITENGFLKQGYKYMESMLE